MRHRKSAPRFGQAWPAGLSIAKSAERANAGATQHRPAQFAQSARSEVREIWRIRHTYQTGNPQVRPRRSDVRAVQMKTGARRPLALSLPYLTFPLIVAALVVSHGRDR